MLTDILIGLIIGIGLERATKISYALQKMIKQAKEAKIKERLRKEFLICKECGPGRNVNCSVHGDKK